MRIKTPMTTVQTQHLNVNYLKSALISKHVLQALGLWMDSNGNRKSMAVVHAMLTTHMQQ